MKIANCEIKKSTIRLSCLFLFIFLSLITIMSYNQRKIFIEAHKENLQILATDKANQINTFLESEKEKFFLISSLGVFREVINNPNDSTKKEVAKSRINEIRNIIPGISIMTSGGIVIVGDIDIPGTDYSQHPYFVSDRQDIAFTRYHDSLRDNEYYAVIGPIYDKLDNSKIIGRIAFDVEVGKIANLLKNLAQNNNYVYLVDADGMILNSSESLFFDKNSVDTQKVFGGSVNECMEDIKKYGINNYIQPHEEEILEYINYKGLEVFGSHAYTPIILGCVIAEESAEEILKFSIIDALQKIFNPFLK